MYRVWHDATGLNGTQHPPHGPQAGPLSFLPTRCRLHWRGGFLFGEDHEEIRLQRGRTYRITDDSRRDQAAKILIDKIDEAAQADDPSAPNRSSLMRRFLIAGLKREAA